MLPATEPTTVALPSPLRVEQVRMPTPGHRRWQHSLHQQRRPGLYTYTVTDDNDCEITGSVTITEPAALSLTGSSTNVTCNGANDGFRSSGCYGWNRFVYLRLGSWYRNTASIDDLARVHTP